MSDTRGPHRARCPERPSSTASVDPSFDHFGLSSDQSLAFPRSIRELCHTGIARCGCREQTVFRAMAPGFGAFSRRRRVIVPILTPFARFTANAPVSRCLVFACAGATIATSMLQCIGLLSLDLRATFARGQLWRLVTSQVAFSTPAELVFGAFLLHTFREFERRFKTSKFAVAVLVLWAVATALQVIFLATGIASRVAPGPYSLIFGLLCTIFQTFRAPHKGAFLCIPLTDKSFTYMWDCS